MARKRLTDGRSLVVRDGRGGVFLEVEGSAERWDFGAAAEAIALLIFAQTRFRACTPREPLELKRFVI